MLMLNEDHEKSQTKRAQQVLSQCLSFLKLQEDVEVIAVSGFRWTLAYEQSPDHPDFGRNMIKLERMLQLLEKRPIDLVLPKEPDKNRRQERNVLWTKIASPSISRKD